MGITHVDVGGGRVVQAGSLSGPALLFEASIEPVGAELRGIAGSGSQDVAIELVEDGGILAWKSRHVGQCGSGVVISADRREIRGAAAFYGVCAGDKAAEVRQRACKREGILVSVRYSE